MRALGVDFGSKLHGIAVGESEHAITSSRPPIKASGTLAKDAAAIAELARKEDADLVVVGIPVNIPEKSERMRRICEQLVERLREQGLTVRTIDEALSSVEGEARLASVYTANVVKKQVHGEAARVIL